MVIYADLFFLINLAVDLLLLLGTNRLCGNKASFWRCMLAASVGALYATACILPGFLFLANILWRAVSLLIMACIAFGNSRDPVRKTAVFFFLSMALGGIGACFGACRFPQLLLSVILLGAVAFAAFKGGQKRFVPVIVTYKGKTLHLTALVDTGNLLKDPLCGESVLVVGAEAAEALFGFPITDPILAVGQRKVPGLRLIPFHSVGNPNGMMAAFRPDSVRINGEEMSLIVGFAANVFEKNGKYQALAGGYAV